MAASGKIYAFRNDRMGSRLIAILNAIRFAKDYDVDFQIYWLLTDGMSEEIKVPAEIFSKRFMEKHFVAKKDFEALEKDMFEIAFRNPGWDRARVKQALNDGQNFMMSHAFASVALFADEEEVDVRRGVAEAFDMLEFSPTVQNAIDKVNQALTSSPIAYHIRRGDIIDPDSNAARKIWPKKYTPREFYEINLQRHVENSDGKIIIFSDEPREVERFRSISSQAISPDELLDADTLTQGQYDFLSLYTMSRCSEIVGPPGSGFSETAALLGNGRVVDVQATLSEADHDAAMALLTDRLAEGEQHFMGLADVGQTLPFAQEFWVKHGRPDVGAKVVRKYMDMGLQRAYAYVIECELLLAAGQYQAALDVREKAREQPEHFDIAMAQLNLMCAKAHLALGDRDGVAQSLALATWAFPNIQGLERNMVQLTINGEISPADFYPYDAALKRVALPGSPAAGGDTPGGIKGAQPIIIPFFATDLVTRDWSDFLGKRRHRLFNKSERIQIIREQIISYSEKVTEKPAMDSLKGVYARELGEIDNALNFHMAAVDAQGDNPLYLKRYADALMAAGLHTEAAVIMTAASDTKKGHPLYSAQLAECLIETRNIDEAIGIYRAIVPRSGRYPEIILKAANVFSRRKGSHKDAMKYGRMAVDISQGSARVLNAYATILKRCNAKRELHDVLITLSHIGNLRPKFQDLLDNFEAQKK